MSRILIFCLILCISLSECTNDKREDSTPLIIVSILPQKFIVEQIAGNRFQVNVLIPPGANHETYEPTPKDMASIETADLYFSVGYLDFELNWLPRFTSSQRHLKVVNTSSGISLIESHDIHERGVDPHTWLSVSNVKIQAQTIANALIHADSIHSDYYIQHLASFEKMADSLDNQIKKRLSTCQGKPFLIFHPALAYFAREYGLEQVSIEYEGKEPSAARIRELIDFAKEKKINTIYISKEFDTRNAEAIAREIHAKIIVFDPMAADWSRNLLHLADLIAENQ